MEITVTADRLYGISLRPQELALHGEEARFTLRYAPVFEDPEEVAEVHYTLLVLEATAEMPADPMIGRPAGSLHLVKCGWELERRVSPPQRVGTLPESPGDAARLLQRIADTVNDLAGRAGLPPPLEAEAVATLLHHYRSGA